jgi:hypothetical protein
MKRVDTGRVVSEVVLMEVAWIPRGWRPAIQCQSDLREADV